VTGVHLTLQNIYYFN